MKSIRIMMNAISSLVLLLALLITVSCGSQSERKTGADKERSRPNLLYIFPDQMRMQAMGFWKDPEFRHLLLTETDPVYTPNIDKLAKKGVIFTQATSTHPVCSPHRAMLMSGMYPSRNGVENVNCHAGRSQGLHNDIECFTDVLDKAGYETAYIGKTHWERTEALFDSTFKYVGTVEKPGGFYANPYDTYIPPGPGRHSVKYWVQLFRDDHFNALEYSNQPDLIDGKKDGEPYQTSRFSTSVEANVIIKYLENKNNERDSDKPFSIFWAPNPPHNPYFSPDDCENDIYEKYYKDMPQDELMYRKNIKAPLESQSEIYDPEKCTSIYYSLVSGVDRQLGRVLQALEESGEADNTIIIFTADHGEMLGSHGVMGKNCIDDESFLVPFVISYPKKIKPRSENLLLASVDIMPSVLGLMGMNDLIPESVEGTNYSRGIESGDFTTCPKPNAALYLNLNRKGVRTNQYSYVVYDTGIAEVTDNLVDPYQLNKLSPDVIPPADLEMLKKELGKRLAIAGDIWAKEHRFSNLITY